MKTRYKELKQFIYNYESRFVLSSPHLLVISKIAYIFLLRKQEN